MSAWAREPTVTISPFRISKAIFYSQKTNPSFSMNLDSHLFAIFLHFLPVFGHVALGFGELSPGNRWPARRLFHHLNAVFHRAHVKAQPASDTIHFTNVNARTRTDRVFFSVRPNIIRLWLDHTSIFANQVNALVGGVVACDVTKIAADTFLLIDARHRSKRQIKIVEVGNAVEATAHDIGNFRETLFIHPVGQPVAQILDDAKSVMHHRGAHLQASRTEQQELRSVAPGGNPSHS